MGFLSDILLDAFRLPELLGADVELPSAVSDVMPSGIEAAVSRSAPSVLGPASPQGRGPAEGDVVVAARAAPYPDDAPRAHAVTVPSSVPMGARESVEEGTEVVSLRRERPGLEHQSIPQTSVTGTAHLPHLEVSPSQFEAPSHTVQALAGSGGLIDTPMAIHRDLKPDAEGGRGRQAAAALPPRLPAMGMVTQAGPPNITLESSQESRVAAVSQVESPEAEKVGLPVPEVEVSRPLLTQVPHTHSRRVIHGDPRSEATVASEQGVLSQEKRLELPAPEKETPRSALTAAPRSAAQRTVSASRAASPPRSRSAERKGRETGVASSAPAEDPPQPRVHIGTVQVIVSSPAPEPQPEREGSAELLHRRYLRSL